MGNNRQIYCFFAKFIVFLAILIVLLSLIGGNSSANEKDIEPLTLDEKQEVIMQIGIVGYKQLVQLNCYQAITVRIRTNEWSDEYCAKSYKHLDFDKIKGNK